MFHPCFQCLPTMKPKMFRAIDVNDSTMNHAWGSSSVPRRSVADFIAQKVRMLQNLSTAIWLSQIPSISLVISIICSSHSQNTLLRWKKVFPYRKSKKNGNNCLAFFGARLILWLKVTQCVMRSILLSVGSRGKLAMVQKNQGSFSMIHRTWDFFKDHFYFGLFWAWGLHT